MRLQSVALLSLAVSGTAIDLLSCLKSGECQADSVVAPDGSPLDLSLPLPQDYFPDPVTPDKVVYRGDPRGPDEIRGYKVNGSPKPGFFPREGPEVSQKYSLFSHVEGNIANTAYVSTTTDLQRAARYAASPTKGGGFVYKIEASKTFIDVNRSMRLMKYIGNMEYSALDGIPWSKVIGYLEVTPDVDMIFQLNTLDRLEFTPNEDYVPSPESDQGVSIRPELAGFPENNRGWEFEPWRSIKKKMGVPDIKDVFDGVLKSPKDFDVYSLHYDDEYSEFVYAVNARTPTDLQQATGIFPDGYVPADYFSDEGPNAGSRVKAEHAAADGESKALVRLYRSFGKAGKAVMNAKGPGKMRIWKIKTTKNMFPQKAIDIAKEDDMLALGGVYWRQIVGHYEFDPIEEQENGRFKDPLTEPDSGKDRFYENDDYRGDLFGNEKHIRAGDLDPESKAHLKGLMELPACKASRGGPEKRSMSCVWTDSIPEQGGKDVFPEDGETGHSSPIEPPEGERPSSLSPEEFELASIADRVSEDEFLLFATRYGLAEIPKTKWSMTLSKARAKLLGYKSFSSASSASLAPKLGISALAGVGFGVWAYQVSEAFHHNVSALDRAKVVTSIVPIVGCAVSGAVDAAKGDPNVLDTSLCVIGDTLLLFGPTAPLGILVHAVRFIISLFDFPKWPTKDVFQETRDNNWQRFLKHNVFQYLYDDAFASILQSTLAIEGLAVGSQGAQEIGALNSTASEAYAIAETDQERMEIEVKTLESTKKIQEEMATEFVKRQRNTLLRLPRTFVENEEKSLRKTAIQYNKEFIEKVGSQETVNHYAQGTQHGDFAGNGAQYLHEELVDDLAKIQNHLWNNPPPMPDVFHVAFVMGQSKSLKIDDAVLSAQSFMRDHGRHGRWIDAVVVRMGREVSRMLQGKITHDKLPDIYNFEDIQAVQDFQILITMKFGQAVEQTKRTWAQRRLSGQSGFLLNDWERRYLQRPSLPPIQESTGSFAVIGMIIDMTDAAVEALLHEVDRGELDRDDDIMMYARWLQATVHEKDWFSIILEAEDIVAAERGELDGWERHEESAEEDGEENPEENEVVGDHERGEDW